VLYDALNSNAIQRRIVGLINDELQRIRKKVVHGLIEMATVGRNMQ
jgi:hypothetical protein